MSDDGKPIYFIPDTAKEVGDYRRKVIENYPTLRDSYAQCVLGGLMSNENVWEAYANATELATACYEIADAMLIERDK